MGSLQPVEALLHLVVEPSYAAAMSESAVSTGRRDLNRPEDRAHRRCVTPGDIVMPTVFETARLDTFFKAHQLRVLSTPEQERMHLEFAETPGELDMFGAGDVLITDVDDLVVDPGKPDLGDHLVGEVPTEPDSLISAPRVTPLGVTVMCSNCGDDSRARSLATWTTGPSSTPNFSMCGEERCERLGPWSSDQQWSWVVL